MANFNWGKLSRPIIGLAPMAEYTDWPFGLICKEQGAQVIFREMISAEAILHNNQKTLRLLKIDKKERPVIQQIFGRDPEKMAQAAKMICKISQPDGIDINMGCPARKVVKNFHGAALMKEPKLAMAIISAVKKAIKVPLSVKTRLGWSKPEEILKFAPLLEKAGADLLTIHARTKDEGFSGLPHWEIIHEVKKNSRIPILANGGIFNREDMKRCLAITSADGVLIARGALGNPWIFSSHLPSLKERIDTILKHARWQIKHYGDGSLILFRKHLMHYFKGLPSSAQTRVALGQVETYSELKRILTDYQNNIA